MKHLAVEDLVAMAVSPPMTRREKLLRWADLVARERRNLHLYHRLEYARASELATTVVSEGTAFAIAAADPVFQQAGLSPHPTVSQVLRFFELTQMEAHEFSCDCGGNIRNDEQACRIQHLANR